MMRWLVPGWLRPLAAPIGPAYRDLVAFSLFVNLLALAAPIFVLQVYDRVVYRAGLSTLQALVVGMAIALLFDFVLRQARSRLLQRLALAVDVGLGRRLAEKIAALPLRTLESQPTPVWQALFRDVETVRNTLAGATALLLSDLPFILVFFGLVAAIAPPVAWVLLAAAGLFVALAALSSIRIGDAAAREREAAQRRDAAVAEMAAGRATVKALALAPAMTAIWADRHADTIEAALTRGRRADRYMNLATSLNFAVTVAMTSIGALAIIAHEMTVGALVAANILAGRFLAPLMQMVGSWRALADHRAALRRLGEAIARAEERAEAAVDLPRPSGRLELQGVSFGYAEDREPILSEIGLRFGPGGVHGVVGRNGSGKTTLLKVMQGLYPPSKGRVLLDGADIAQLTRAQLAGWIGYAPQECVLFSGTIRDNIARPKPEASDAEILAAAELAGVHRTIIDLPDGYGAEIGEAGGRLSGGQRQRLALARALLRNPPVLLLDEPSSNLDRQAEEELRDLIVRLGRDHTVVVVTHSATLLAACNSVMALHNGRIALAGPAQEVLDKLFGGQRARSAG
jgi:ATP-binding cassette subfamily C protein LapB